MVLRNFCSFHTLLQLVAVMRLYVGFQTFEEEEEDAGIDSVSAWIGKRCFDPNLSSIRYFTLAYLFLSCLFVISN